jgi:hypothetical protein
MMKAAGHIGAAVAMACAANPCLAQDQMRFAQQPAQERGAFAGVNLRLDLGSRERPKPVARLAIGPAFERNAGDGILPTRSRAPDAGFEFGLSRSGRAELHVAGQPAARLSERLGAKGDLLSPPVIVFGVLLIGVGILVLSSSGDVGTVFPPSQ